MTLTSNFYFFLLWGLGALLISRCTGSYVFFLRRINIAEVTLLKSMGKNRQLHFWNSEELSEDNMWRKLQWVIKTAFY